jgi:hypothetical protein
MPAISLRTALPTDASRSTGYEWHRYSIRKRGLIDLFLDLSPGLHEDRRLDPRHEEGLEP